MKLERLSLTNFRQFYGVQKLIFDHTQKRNVCMVYAANGAGKTTLLNALTWVLYKELSEDFEQPERLLNYRAWRECDEKSTVDVTVELEFTHDSRSYIAKRTHRVRKEGGQQVIIIEGDPELNYRTEQGEFGTLKNPSNAIDQILPERLHSFFFFNGERIERLVQPKAYQEIEIAIKILLGLEVIERGTNHLSEAIKDLRRKQGQIGSKESQDIVDKLENLESEKEILEDKLENLSGEVSALDKEQKQIKARLRTMVATRDLQQKRERVELNLKASLTNDKVLRGELKNLLATKGFLVFLTDLADQVLALIEEYHTKGTIPAPIKRQFVEEILENGVCICDTHLVKGEPAYISVERWLQRGGVADVEDAVIGLRAEIKHYFKDRSELLRAIADLTEKIASNRKERKELNEQFDELSEELKDSPLEDVTRLENRREEIENNLRSLEMKRGSNKANIASVEKEINIQQKNLEKVHERHGKAVLAQRRVLIAQEAHDFFADVYDLRSQDVRLELDVLIKKIYARISFKDYRPHLNEDFQLELCDPNRNNALVPKSTGENQILSLSFVGALASLTRKHESDPSDKQFGALLGFEGGSYPVVIDAAFGQLDENYQRAVARSLPKLANQVIVFVSKSQGIGPVQEEMNSVTAGISVLNYRTPKENTEEETITIRGEDYPYITRSTDGSEWASIDRIKE